MPLPSGALTQVCYVTNNIEKAIKRWADVMKAGPFFMLNPPPLEKNYRGRLVTDTFVNAVGFAGNTQIELCQPTNNEPSVFKEILDLKGDGAMHHIFPDIKPIDDAAFAARRKTYDEAGFKVGMELDIPGVGHVIFYDALESLGFFIEMAALGPETPEMCNRMYDAHRSWDGRNPIRQAAELMRG